MLFQLSSSSCMATNEAVQVPTISKKRLAEEAALVGRRTKLKEVCIETVGTWRIGHPRTSKSLAFRAHLQAEKRATKLLAEQAAKVGRTKRMPETSVETVGIVGGCNRHKKRTNEKPYSEDAQPEKRVKMTKALQLNTDKKRISSNNETRQPKKQRLETRMEKAVEASLMGEEPVQRLASCGEKATKFAAEGEGSGNESEEDNCSLPEPAFPKHATCRRKRKHGSRCCDQLERVTGCLLEKDLESDEEEYLLKRALQLYSQKNQPQSCKNKQQQW